MYLLPEQKSKFEEMCRKKLEAREKGARSGKRGRISEPENKNCRTNKTGERLSMDLLNNTATAK